MAPLLLACLSVAQAGGGGSVCAGSPMMDLAGIQTRLKAAEALWQRRGPASYRLNIQQRGAWENADLQVNVPANAPAWVVVVPRLGPLDPLPTSHLAQQLNVPGLFARVQAVLDAHRTSSERCGVLKVVFDAHDGHVRVLDHDGLPIDDEFTYTISPVLPLR